MPHLPYAQDDDDEFRHPTEGWLLLDRTIAFDSWISWRHALPADRNGRTLLHESAAALIRALAERLHAIHQRLPGYADLDDSPFVFPRWWDPDPESEWHSGGRCLFRVEGHSADAILTAALSSRSNCLRLSSASGGLLEAELVTTDKDSACPPVPSLPAFRSRSRGSRRKRLPPPL